MERSGSSKNELSKEVEERSNRDTKPGRAEPGSGEILIYDNSTVGQARIMTGNVGVENWRRTAGQKTAIAGNKVGQDERDHDRRSGRRCGNGFQ